ncbi:hypothetical protein ACFQ2K_44775 [Streptomyces sanglieri]|uniref:Uncharacterized protein n=1 Tax=Streptomyces sanglieri TaxID=193460 RepID=A0ABW2XA22_9ACTN
MLGALPGLERIRFYNTYDIDAAAFPRPEMFHDLQLVSFDGLFTSDAKVLRERLKGFWNAHVNHPRSAKWMAENINNPFRSWGDDDRTLGRRANELWRNALTDARRQDSVADSLRIVTEFTDGLRVLAEEFPLDTLCREQATEALDRLAHLELGLPEGTDAVPSQGWEW